MFFLCFASCSSYIEKNKKIGNTIIEEVERFKKDNGHPPNWLYYVGSDSVFLDFQNDIAVIGETDLLEVGLSVLEIDGEVFCYQRIDSTDYMIWFGTSLGEGIYYYSDTKKWEEKMR
ncbi:MAG: hypothetical protein IJ563_02400 [Selenomonadaceae bacterium]|nr:hypothetical protein [Selenomonadaceae bacterium]